MNAITKESLEFLEDAKQSFLKEDQQTTYSNDEFIALRTGFREDCISIYKLDGEVGMFTEQLPSQHKVLVDYEELNKVEKLKDILKESSIEIGSDGYKKEFNSALKIINNITKYLDGINFKTS